jgi:iron(III) transport system permease protein
MIFRDVVLLGMRPFLLAGFIMVSIDVLKELLLALLLRPFTYDTLAIRAFDYASNERLAEASPYALLIVVAG